MTSTKIDQKKKWKEKWKKGLKGLKNKQNNKINKNSRHARYTVKFLQKNIIKTLLIMV